jgi:Zn-dependent protease
MEQLSTVQTFTIYILPILFAITIHEVAHGWMASKLGDKTAYILGRITLNPFKHIDLIGTILVPTMLMLFGGVVFGWAKPVPVNFSNLKHPHRDVALVSLAGPFSNFIMTILWAGIAKVGLLLLQLNYPWLWPNALIFMGHVGVQINLIFMILNLIPIPPLDGSRIFLALLPIKIAKKMGRIEPYGFIFLLILLGTRVLDYIIYPPVIFLSSFITFLFHI